jgi:predicted SAM-dependent methyltransferase
MFSSMEAFGKEVKEPMDVITLWHVLEHVSELTEYIQTIRTVLSDHGALVVAVPNFESYDAKFYKQHWAAYDVPRHLWHFNQSAIEGLFGKLGFRLEDVRPMYFDSYYVSLLSEKYKTGRSRFLPALYRGALSNWKARSSGQYSSLIYILKKQ